MEGSRKGGQNSFLASVAAVRRARCRPARSGAAQALVTTRRDQKRIFFSPTLVPAVRQSAMSLVTAIESHTGVVIASEPWRGGGEPVVEGLCQGPTGLSSVRGAENRHAIACRKSAY